MTYRSRKIVEAVPFDGKAILGVLVREEGVNNGFPTKRVVDGQYHPMPPGVGWFGTPNVHAGGTVVHPGDMLLISGGKVVDVMPSATFAAEYEEVVEFAFEVTAIDERLLPVEAAVPTAPIEVEVAAPLSMNAKPDAEPVARAVVSMAGEKGAKKK